MAKSKMVDPTGWDKFEHKTATGNKKWKSEIFETTLDKMVLHEFANEHPKMTPNRFRSFVETIKEEGQNEPVITFRGKIVDGRHRYWALNEIEADKIFYVKMPHRSTEEEIRKEVGLSEVRRHQTPTQIAIQAYKKNIELGESKRATADRFGISHAQISRCATIAEELGSNVLEKLWNGESIDVNGRTNLATLSTIVAEIKKMHAEEEVSKNTHNTKYQPDSPSLEAVINTMRKLSDADFGYLVQSVKAERKVRAEREL